MGVNSSCRSSGLLCPSAFPPLKAVATDWMNCNKELTAAGLHRIHTCFPFNPHSRKESFRGTRLGKGSERRAKKKEIYLFFIPSRILSSSERQSSERREKKNQAWLIFFPSRILFSRFISKILTNEWDKYAEVAPIGATSVIHLLITFNDYAILYLKSTTPSFNG